jgi:hypothetical protein
LTNKLFIQKAIVNAYKREQKLDSLVLAYSLIKQIQKGGGEREEEEEEEEARETLASPFTRVLKTDPTLVIYKSMVISIRSLELALATNKLLNKSILFRPLICPLCRKAPKGYIDLIINRD